MNTSVLRSITEVRKSDARLRDSIASVHLSAKSILLGLILLSILVRAVGALYLGDRAEPISGAYDQITYDTLAQSVLHGRAFTFPVAWYPFTPADEPTAHWSFLYTLYLSSVYAMFGHHPLAARLIQIIVSSLQLWLVYRISVKSFDDRVGLVSAALTALYAYFIFFSAALMTQAFYILAVLAVLDLALSLIRMPARRDWILFGFAIGLGALFRQTLLLFAPLMLAWIVFTGHRPVKWGDLLLSVTVIALLILPWTLYNYQTFHDFLLLNSNGGFWFYSSNYPTQGTHFDPNFVAPIPAELQRLSEPALDRALFREAFGFILADPARFLLLSLDRAKDYFWLGPSEQSSLISNVSRLLSFTLYLPFMLFGLLLSRRKWRACLPLYLYVAFDTCLCLISWSAPRYRLPSDAVMMVFGGLAVVTLGERLGNRSLVSQEQSRRFERVNVQ